MSPCSSTPDCYKASLQYKIDRATGKTTAGETKLQWQTANPVQTETPQSVKSPSLGTQFDRAG